MRRPRTPPALENLNRMQTEFAGHRFPCRLKTTGDRGAHLRGGAAPPTDIDDPEIRRKCLAGIDLSSQRLGRLARTLLDDVSGSRVDPVPMTFETTPIDVAALASRALAQVAPTNDFQYIPWSLRRRTGRQASGRMRTDSRMCWRTCSTTRSSSRRPPPRLPCGSTSGGQRAGGGIARSGLRDPTRRASSRVRSLLSGSNRAWTASADGSDLGLYIAKGVHRDDGRADLGPESSPGAGGTDSPWSRSR